MRSTNIGHHREGFVRGASERCSSNERNDTDSFYILQAKFLEFRLAVVLAPLAAEMEALIPQQAGAVRVRQRAAGPCKGGGGSNRNCSRKPSGNSAQVGLAPPRHPLIIVQPARGETTGRWRLDELGASPTAPHATRLS